MQTAEERYSYAWRDFQASQERGDYKTLKSYCQSHHIHYEGMRYWKRKNCQSMPNASKSRKEAAPEFISITQSPFTSAPSTGVTDVQITSPTGLSVRIGTLSVEALVQILSIQKGDAPCSL